MGSARSADTNAFPPKIPESKRFFHAPRGSLVCQYNFMNNQTKKFFIYTRKSTDDKDRQVRSIADQLSELKELARKEDLDIVDVFVEKQTAKIPGRPVFGEMIERMEKGEATGILAWHPLCKHTPCVYPSDESVCTIKARPFFKEQERPFNGGLDVLQCLKHPFGNLVFKTS